MKNKTLLTLNDKLPLTCTRSGTCCHGKSVKINPFELAQLAYAKKLSTKEFKDLYCDWEGTLLSFDGPQGWNQLNACSQYIIDFGCSVHSGRPLACRLFPLGKQTQSQKHQYIFEGSSFPCLEGCPDVKKLEHLTVAEYVSGQETKDYEWVQDEYLEVMQNIADVAFVLLLDTGLYKTHGKEILKTWKQLSLDTPDKLASRVQALCPEFLEVLITPDLNSHLSSPQEFIKKHNELILQAADSYCKNLKTENEFKSGSILMVSLAILLARSLGLDIFELGSHWAKIAKANGV